MTQEELFREIDEDIERQRYEALWKKYGACVVALVVAIIGGTAGESLWQKHNEQTQYDLTDQVMTAMVNASDNGTKAVPELLEFATMNKGLSQAAIAEIRAADEEMLEGKRDDAVKIYDSLAANEATEPEFRQLATLESVRAQADNGDAGLLLDRLQPLMADKQPWRFSAMEVAGYIAYRSGDKAKAKQIYTDLSQSAEAPSSLTSRASEMLRLVTE